MPRKYKEDNLQIATARYLDMKKFLWCHVANERKSSVKAGARLKAKGVKSGVPDVLIFEPSGEFVGLAIELKIKPNKVSGNQRDWLLRLEMRGWDVAICFDIEDVIKTVDNYKNKQLD